MPDKARGFWLVTLVLVVGGFLVSRFLAKSGTQPQVSTSAETSRVILPPTRPKSPATGLVDVPPLEPSPVPSPQPAVPAQVDSDQSSRFWLRGTVKSSQHEPVETFDVAVFSHYAPATPSDHTQTFHSPLGEFELEWDTAGPIDVVVKAKGFIEGVLPQVTLATREENASPYEILLIPASRIEGVVVNDSGQPVAGALVELGQYGYSVKVSPTQGVLSPEDQEAIQSYMKRSNPNPWQETNAKGHFALAQLPHGSYPLHVSHADYFPTSQQVSLHPGGVVEHLRFVLSKHGGTIVIRVHDAQGLPMASQTVEIEGQGEPIQGQTDTQGIFRIEDLPPGTYRAMLQLSAPDMVQAAAIRWAEIMVKAGAESLVTLVVQPGVTVIGEVSKGNRPVAGAYVVATQVDSASTQETEENQLPVIYASAGAQTDATGGFELADLAAGAYQLAVMDGETSVQVLFVLHASERQRFIRIMLGSGQLSGVVKDGITGQPIEGASIRSFLTEPLQDSQEEEGMFHASVEREVMTDADGRYQLSGLAFGRYVLEAKGLSYGKTRQTVELTSEAVFQNMILMPAGQLIVTITDAQHLPLPGISVSVTSQYDSEDGILMTTDLHGIVQLTDLAPGVYEVSVGSDDQTGPAFRTTVTISSQTIERLPVIL